ncbi:MAG: RidA family protein [Actinobacteria bacterium]|nr:RidA family protein [Actinomycetota bacterium]
MREVIPGAQAASGRPFSGAAIANGFVFVSGQTFGEGEDIEAQTHGAVAKISELLTKAGTDLAHAIRCTVFMSDLGLYDRMNAAYAQHFPHDPPARAVIGCHLGSPNVLIEVDCIAVLPES